MSASNSQITLQNAGLFSELAYADLPSAFTSLIAYGVSSVNTNWRYYVDAETLQQGGWTDVTSTIGLPLPAEKDGNKFVVFQNSGTQQFVIAFRGSSNLQNWAADLSSGDQGQSAYNAISVSALAAYNTLKPLFPSYTFFTDGHSLGGGIAQTFSAETQISGFAENSLPISPFYAGQDKDAISQFRSSPTLFFRDLVTEGDPATAFFVSQNGTYLNSNFVWIGANYSTTEALALAKQNLLNKAWKATNVFNPTLVNALLNAHSIGNQNVLALEQIPDGADPKSYVSGWLADPASQQQAIYAIGQSLLNFPVINLGLAVIETYENGHLILSYDPGQSPSASTAGFVPTGTDTNVVFGSSLQQTGIKDPSGADVLVAGPQPTTIFGGTGTDIMIGGPVSSVMYGGTGADTFVFDVSGATSVATETIIDQTGNGGVFVNGSSYAQLTGGTAVAGKFDTWADASGTTYVFGGAPDSSVGTLTISGGVLGTSPADSIVIQDFNIATADSSSNGFLGVILPESISVTAGASAGTPEPANFPAGSLQSYTLSTNVPSSVAQVITITLSGAQASDFMAVVGQNYVPLSANGSFTITLAAGQANVAFGLVDTTINDGSSDIASGAVLSLTASAPNLTVTNGMPIQSAALTINYLPQVANTTAPPNPTDVITGSYDSVTGITTYSGDAGDDVITTSGTKNLVFAQTSGNDSITGTGNTTVHGSSGNNVISVSGTQDAVTLGGGFNTLSGGTGHDTLVGASFGSDIVQGNGGTDLIMLGNGTNQVYAGAELGLGQALGSASAITATGQQGDLISVADGNNTIVGGAGNDLVVTGAGHDVVVMGPGTDYLFAGEEVNGALANWSVTHSGNSWYTNNVYNFFEGWANPYPQPYNGNTIAGSTTPVGPSNVTVYGGTGNDLFFLGNGNNYVEMGSGTSTTEGGMGNDTIVAGSGSDLVHGGGGTTYIQGGAGADTLAGGDGNNTILGGSGNSTIYASNGPSGNAIFAGNNLVQDYVDGGSGNDLIYGGAGADTLISGTGNSTIYAGTGSEYIVGGSGNNVLVDGPGNDTLVAGGAGADTLLGFGSSSATTLMYGGGGKDSITGGSGNTTIYAGDGGTAGAATSVFGSQSDSTASTTVYGGAGVDFLEAGIGSTVIYGGDGGTSSAPTTVIGFTSGQDTLYGGMGTDLVQGGNGTNVLYAGGGGTSAAPTTVLGGGGTSTLYGGAGVSILQDTQSGNDLIVSQGSNDSLIGVGNDTLVAGTGNDALQTENNSAPTLVFNPGFGNDTVTNTTGGMETLAFGSGIAATDFSGTVTWDGSGNSYLGLYGDGGSITLENALTGNLIGVSVSGTLLPVTTFLTDVFGGDSTFADGSSTLIISLGNTESVTAGPNSDTISAWGNNDTLQGGTGTTAKVIYSAGSAVYIASGSNTADSITAVGNNDSVSAGTGGYSRITVTGANSIVTSVSGADTLTATGSSDTLVGGTGNVTFNVNSASTVVQQSAGGGVDKLNASVSYTAPSNVNILTLTGSANISATGNAASDTLTGGAGSDTLIAGSAADTLVGGTGATTFVVNNTGDVVQDSHAATNTVQSSVNFSLPTNVNALILIGSANLAGTANTGADTLTSNSGVDTLTGGSGNDTFIVNNSADVVSDTSTTASNTIQIPYSFVLPANVKTLVLTGTNNVTGTANSANDTLISNSGLDTLVGGAGNDTFIVNNTGDVVQDTSTTATNTLQSSVSYSLPINVNSLTLTSTANIKGTGNAATDTLTAGAGQDTLVAGAGVAKFYAGSGNDTFIVNNTADTISDTFTTTADTVQSSVNFTLPTNVNSLILTGTGNLTGTANSGNDTLTANSGADTLTGGAGNDTFVVNSTADVVKDTSSTANNTIFSSVSITLPTDVNTLELTGSGNLVGTTNSANDLLIGNSGNDSLIATSGADTLVAGTGVDTLSGGSSTTFVLNNTGDVVVSSTGGTIEAPFSYTLPGHASGTYTLVLTGSGNLAGTAVSGSNSIIGNAGNDTLTGGSGTDTLVAGVGVDTLVGGSNLDTFVLNNTADVVSNLSTVAGGNTVYASFSYTMPSNVGSLYLTGTANLQGVGNSQSNNIYANAGNDTLIAGTGIATLHGGQGTEVYIVDSSSDVVVGNLITVGMDTVESSASYSLPSLVNNLILTGSANLSASGNGAADLIVGNAGSDTLNAGNGAATLVAGTGPDTMIGGTGDDTFIINSTSDLIQDTTANHVNVVVSSVSYSLPTNINTLVLTGSGNLKGVANAANDSLVGGSGADTLVAGAGVDTLVSGAGPTTLVGGAGSDTFIVSSAADVIQNASSSGTNVVLAYGSYTLPTNVSTLTLLGAANIAGTGNSAADRITAGAGQDTLIAGTGVATLVGGFGNDTFVVNNTADVVQDPITTTANGIQASVSYSLPTNVNLLTLTGTGSLVGTANSGADTLTSNSGIDTLVGGAGNDTFVVNNAADLVQDTAGSANNTVQASVNFTLGANVNNLVLIGSGNLKGTANSGNDTLTSNPGIDTLVGGAGNDTFIISNTADVIVDSSATSSNVVTASISYTLPTNVNVLVLTGTANISATGNSAADTLIAGAGSDTLVAGSGVATLVGGAGSDTFVVNNASDVVQDSVVGSGSVIQSSVGYTLPTNVNCLVLTGTANLIAAANAGGDTLVSNYGIDTLIAGSGPDVIYVNNAADVIQNLASNDTVVALDNYTVPGGGYLIQGGSANLVATGSVSADTLVAGGGADTLVAGSGIATLVGGAGNDTFVVNSQSDVVQDTNYLTSNTLQSSVTYTLPMNVDTLVMTGTLGIAGFGNGDLTNVLTANSGADALYGESNFDTTIYGGAGSDVLNAAPGATVIYAGNGGTTASPTQVNAFASGTSALSQATLYGGTGVSHLQGGPGFNLIYGGAGTTTIYSGSGVNQIYVGSGGTSAVPTQVLSTAETSVTESTIWGGSGTDVINGGAGQDLIYGGSGASTILGGTGPDTLVAGSGTTVLSVATGGSAPVYEVNPGFGNVTIGNGSIGVNNVQLGSGLEPNSFTINLGETGSTNSLTSVGLILTDGASSIALPGGMLPGILNTATFADTGAESFIQLVQQDASGSIVFTDPYGNKYNFSAGNNQTVVGSVSIAGFYAYGNNDSLVATNEQTPIDAYGSYDTINGGTSSGNIYAAGNADFVNLTGGSASLLGGSDTLVGNGTIWNFQSSNVIQVTSPGTVINSYVSYSLPSNVQTLNLETSGITGTSNAVGGSLIAYGSADTLVGGSGVDYLDAIGTNDVLVGGSGAETYVLNDSSDSLQVGTGSASLNSVQVNFSYTLPVGINTLTQNASSAIGAGNSSNDSLVASGTSDTLVAGAGNDTLSALGASDTLVGGAGNDTFKVTNTSDVVIDTSAISTNTLYTSANYTLPSNVATLVVTQGGVVGTANTGNDTLIADSYGDTLVAGTGNDVLQDQAPAGVGANTFLFNSGFGTDQVLGPQNGDVIKFGSGVSQSSITFSAIQGPGSAPSLVIAQSGGGSITVQGGLVPGAVGSIVFTGGSTLTVPQALALGRETVSGSGGNLILTGSNSDTVTAGTGQDTIIAWGTSDTLQAGSGGTVIYAGGSGDKVTGGAGTDSLVADAANTTLIGGAGNESLVVNNSTTSVQVSAGIGHDTVYSSVNYTLPTNVTAMTMTGSAGLTATANSGNDIITANAGGDTLTDGSGVDTLVGGAGNDVFNVSNTADVITDLSGSNTINSTVSFSLPTHVDTLILQGSGGIVGTGNNDASITLRNSTTGSVTLIGGSGTDSLVAGNAGDDSLVSGTGVDTLVSGYYLTTLVVNNSQDVIRSGNGPNGIFLYTSVNYDLATSLAGASWTLMGSGNLVASDSGGTNVSITGNAGSDTITGGSGVNTLSAGTGVDTLIGGGAGSSTTFIVNSSSDIVIGHPGESDTVQSSVNYTLPGNVNSLLFTGTGALKGTANSGSDTLTSNSGVDTLVGGSGNDTFVVNNSADVISDTSGTSNNTVQASVSFSLPTNVNTLYLTSGAALKGTANSGNDTLTTDSGVYTLVGGSGNDTFVVNNSADVVTDTSATATNALQSSVSYTLPTNVNTLILTGTSALQGTANAGTDTLISNSGMDTLVGGSGNDTFVVNNASDVVTDTSASASNTLSSSVSYTLPTNVNTLVVTGTAAVVGTGNAHTNLLTANSGADTLVAGSGLATMAGGAGNDTFVVNNAGDVVTDTSSLANNTLSSSVSYSLPTNVNTLVLTGASALTGTANSGNDTLTSNLAADTLVGGIGNDTFVVNNASDVVKDTASGANNTIVSSVSYSLPTNVNTLILTGTGNIAGTGNSSNDTLTAGAGLDTLTAGSGNDTLIAGTAADTLVGGGGNDTFVVNSTADVVTDTSGTTSNVLFSSANYTLPTNVDTLVLTGTVALSATGNAQADSLVANSGNDTLVAGSGVATLVGGAGIDTFVVDSASDVINDTATNGANTVESSVSYSLSAIANTLILIGTGSIQGTANGGNDTLTSNSGVDTLVGGVGNETFIINNSADVVVETSATSSNVVQTSVNYTLPSYVTTMVLSGTAALMATGNYEADAIVANSGADTLIAGAGIASLTGGSGNDTFVINNVYDVITDTSATATNVLQSSVSYTLPTNVNSLVLTGTAALSGTGNAAADSLTANGGADTLTAGSGLATMIGGAGNDTFVVTNTGDVVTDTSASATNTISSSVNYSLPTNVNSLLFTGATALKGTANNGNDTLTSNTGADTLVGGSGNDTFVIKNTADVVTDTSATASNTISSSVTYSLPANVNSLILTGTSLKGTANAGNDTLTANANSDTLVGGAGNETFIVNGTSDVITDTSATATNVLQSSVSYTLPTNVTFLTLAGSGNLTGTGNAQTDLIVANSGNDTLTGGTGISVLEAGPSSGADLLKATSNQGGLLGGAGPSTLTGGAYKDFFAAGSGATTISTGATANVVAVNKGDSATTLKPGGGAANVLSLGAGIDTESLFFTKSGYNLLLTDGVGDTITFNNWYVGQSNQNFVTLQVVEIASSSYNSLGSDPLRNQALEEFNFSTLVSAFNNAGAPINWALSNAMPSAQLSSSASAAYGGDLAYYFGLNGNLTGMNLSAAQSTLTNASFATGSQTIDSWGSISGGGGLHLLVGKPVNSFSAVGSGNSQAEHRTVRNTQTTRTGNPSLVKSDEPSNPVAQKAAVPVLSTGETWRQEVWVGRDLIVNDWGGSARELRLEERNIDNGRRGVGSSLARGDGWELDTNAGGASKSSAAISKSVASNRLDVALSLDEPGKRDGRPDPRAERVFVTATHAAWLAVDTMRVEPVAGGSMPIEGEQRVGQPAVLAGGSEAMRQIQIITGPEDQLLGKKSS